MDWKAIAGILVLPLLVLGLWYGLSQYQQSRVAPVDQVDFSRDGNLIKDVPGLSPDAWHLVYEEPGAPALTVALLFDHDSRCGSESMLEICNISFEQGERVHIEGIQNGDLVTVKKLFYIAN